MAHDLEEKLGEESELVKSSGGIFNVEDNGELIFSKAEVNRFPGEAEIFEIISGVESGLSLEEAKAKAKVNIPEPLSFFEWFKNKLFSKGKTT